MFIWKRVLKDLSFILSTVKQFPNFDLIRLSDLKCRYPVVKTTKSRNWYP